MTSVTHVTALASFGERIRRAVDEAFEPGDANTADLNTDISCGVDNWPWLVEAHGRTT